MTKGSDNLDKAIDSVVQLKSVASSFERSAAVYIFIEYPTTCKLQEVIRAHFIAEYVQQNISRQLSSSWVSYFTYKSPA